MRNLICTLILAAFVYGLSWLLRLLADSIDFPWFMAFCGAAVAIEVALAFAWDYFEARR